MLKSVISEYHHNKEYDYIFFLSKSKKKKISTESIILRLAPENFSHLIGCQKLSDMTFTKHSFKLFNNLYKDLVQKKIDTNTDFVSITRSSKHHEITSRLELLNDFKNLIENPEIKLYQYNPNKNRTFHSDIAYDYVIDFRDKECTKNCYLFCKRNPFKSFIIEPVSIFKTDKNYHTGDTYWNIESLYVSKKRYEKEMKSLYKEYPLGYN